ncbi:helix-turn-helix transcriptional regulator [Clostridium sp. BNL1100]|uniref:helix-turn-helix transcriptional regulator n=1 Tax=Clostridium sp. BNL1100 TaxID=755731 RepID=UPI00024A7DBD|nr:helix-turn-helix transcriptional regulator [Clostridium sp. BNL1100]AEY65378.1 putative transcriptional regulator [Clostridium sp. BNL1100]
MFSENLRKLREFKKMDRTQLAKELDISAQAVGQFELGKRDPSLDTLKKISSFFGVTIDTLISDDDEKVNITKIKDLIKKLNYTIKEFAQDICEPVNEIEKIVVYDTEPSPQILNSICLKYGLPMSFFEERKDSEYVNFCKNQENKKYINLAMFVKSNGYDPDNVLALLKITELIKSKE